MIEALKDVYKIESIVGHLIDYKLIIWGGNSYLIKISRQYKTKK